MTHTKREFFVRVTGALIVACTISCASDDGSPPPGPPPPDGGQLPGPTINCTANGASATIVANHGHALMIPATDIRDATPRSYIIQGSAQHPHVVELTTDDFELLARNMPIVVESSIDGDQEFPLHSHTIRIFCA